MTSDAPTRTAQPDAPTRSAADPDATHSELGTASLAAVGAVEAFQRALTSAPPAAEFDPPPGFELEKELGAGGMGVVYLARQLGLNRPVALKLVKGATAIDAKALIRFLAEAEVVAAIRHPNVVEVYQYGEHGGRPYMALEYCPGGDLTSLTKSTPTRDAAWFRKIADLMAKVADGVNAAHALGIVHRDLKPHNVFLANPPGEPAASAAWVPKVADFGLAKRGLGSDLTNTEAVMGTPAYMAPEQAGGGTKFVGPEADVWALGVMLYELCCGDRPIDTSGPILDALARVANPSVPSVRTKLPTVPADLSLITHKCLSPDPRDRYPTAGALANDLRCWLDGKPITARRISAGLKAWKWARRNPLVAGLVVALSATLTAGFASAFTLWQRAEEETNRVREAAELNRSLAKEADDKAVKLEAAFDSLRKSNEETNLTLARSLLSPISPSQKELDVYEQKALWELTSLRGGTLPISTLREATASALTVTQFRARAEYLDHAAVGLDSRRRREAETLLTQRLRDPALSEALKRDIALAAVSAERFGASDAIVSVLAAALSKATRASERRELAEALATAAQWLPADHAALVCGAAADQLADALGKATTSTPSGVWGGSPDRRDLAAGLVAVAQRLTPDRAADLLTYALRNETTAPERRVLAAALAAVAERLPPERAAAVCEPVATGLADALGKATVFERSVLVSGLVTVARRMPAGKEAVVCEAAADLLASALGKATRASDRWELGRALAAVAVRLPPDRGAARETAALLLADALGKATTPSDRRGLAGGLVAVAHGLPPDRAAVCERAAEVLSETLSDAPTASGRLVAAEASEQRVLASKLATVAQRLPPDRGAEVLTTALGKVNTGSERRELAKGLAAVAWGLPPDRAAAACARAADLLTNALSRGPRGLERQHLAAALAAVVGSHPEGHAAVRRERDDVLAILGWEPDEGEQWTLKSVLSGGNRALPNESVTHAAIAGVVAVHLDFILRARPLPPQQLVELLKHPFVVKEARRAVLDALEFTCERKFADLWEFVDFAEKHTDLDLLTPPKRPAK